MYRRHTVGLRCDLPLMCAYAAMLLLRRSISFFFTSMLIFDFAFFTPAKTYDIPYWICLNATRHHINSLPGATSLSKEAFLQCQVLCGAWMSNPLTTVLFHTPSGGWDEAFKCQTKAPLCPPKVLPSTGIIIMHLAHGTLPLPYSLNHDGPL